MSADCKLISIFGNVQDPRSHIYQLNGLVDIHSCWNNFSDLFKLLT
jgi:hypothetical protein